MQASIIRTGIMFGGKDLPILRSKSSNRLERRLARCANEPIRKAFQFFSFSKSMSLDRERIQITTSIKGLDQHIDKRLKTFVQNFLWKAGIGCNIERIPHSTNPLDVSTIIVFEGKFGAVQTVKLALITSLKKKFPQISIPADNEWVVESSKEKLSAARIVQTKASIRRGESSGEVSKSIPLGRMDALSSSASSWIQNMYKKAIEVLPIAQALQTTGQLEAKLIHVHYKKQVEKMDVSILLWDDFLVRCRDRFEISGHIRKICEKRMDGMYERIRAMEELEKDHDYYIEVEGESELVSPSVSTQASVPTSPEVKAFANMEDFYEVLQKDQGLDGDDIKNIEGVFEKEKIKVKQLLRLTDEKLKEAGVSQIGLREAILAVLGK